MTRINCLIHCPDQTFVGAHRDGVEWGRKEAELVDGVWVGLPPFEIVAIDVDLDSPPASVELVCQMSGTVTVDWDVLQGYI